MTDTVMYGVFGRFELYSITIKEIVGRRPRRRLRTIIFDSPYLSEKKETLFEWDERENIPIGKPLSLRGPSRPCVPYDLQFIVFGDPDKCWRFRVDYDKVREQGSLNTPLEECIYDPNSGSCAVVCYEILSKAVDAELELNYEDDEDQERVIQITEGEIYATTNGTESTKRVLRSFGLSETSISKKDDRSHKKGAEELFPGEPIYLDRSVIGLPIRSVLNITVDLKYRLVPFTKQGKPPLPVDIIHGDIHKSHLSPVPDYPSKSVLDFSDDNVRGPKLHLKVRWCDDTYSKNLFSLTKHLSEIGINLSEIGIIPDEVERAPRNLSSLANYYSKSEISFDDVITQPAILTPQLRVSKLDSDEDTIDIPIQNVDAVNQELDLFVQMYTHEELEQRYRYAISLIQQVRNCVAELTSSYRQKHLSSIQSAIDRANIAEVEVQNLTQQLNQLQQSSE